MDDNDIDGAMRSPAAHIIGGGGSAVITIKYVHSNGSCSRQIETLLINS